jgi:hypothetical protein
MYSCPECEQLINQASEVCPYCGADQKALADTELLLAGKTPKPARTNYQRVALVCGVLLAILWAIAWFAVPGRHSASHQHLPAKRRQRPAIPRDSQRQRPQSLPIRATGPLHPAIHARNTNPVRPYHRLYPNGPSRKFRLPQLLHRRIRDHARHLRRSHSNGPRSSTESPALMGNLIQENFSLRRLSEFVRYG